MQRSFRAAAVFFGAALALCLLAPARGTISTQSNEVTDACNGASTSFNYGFPAVSAGDIAVIVTDSAGVATTLSANQYTLTMSAVPTGQIWSLGGTVAYPLSGAPCPLGSTVTIQRTLPLTQSLPFANQATIVPRSLEQGLDIVTMLAQQNSTQIGKAIVVAPSDTQPPPLPPAANRANKALVFDASGNPTAGSIPSGGVISSAMQPVVEASTLAAARTAMGLGPLATLDLSTAAVFSSRAAAAAANIDVSVGMVYLTGYYAAGDNGQGAVYVRGTAATTGAGFTSADGQDWKLVNRQVTWEMFGAYGDDTHDDGAAISNTCAYANARLANAISAKPGATYLIWSSVPASGTLCLFDNAATSVTIDMSGSSIDAKLPTSTSSTSHTIGTGSQTFTVGASAGWKVGDAVIVWVNNTARLYDSTAYETATVTAYSGTSLTVNVSATTGSGTYSDWTVSPVVSPDLFVVTAGAGYVIRNLTGTWSNNQVRTYGLGVNWIAFGSTGVTERGVIIENMNLTGGGCGACFSGDGVAAGITNWRVTGSCTMVFYCLTNAQSGSQGYFNITSVNAGRSYTAYNVADVRGVLHSKTTDAGTLDDVAIAVTYPNFYVGGYTKNINIDYYDEFSTQGRAHVTLYNYAAAAGNGVSLDGIRIHFNIDLSYIASTTVGTLFYTQGVTSAGACGDPAITLYDIDVSGFVLGNGKAGDGNLFQLMPQGCYNGTSKGFFSIHDLWMPSMTKPFLIGTGAITSLKNVYAPVSAAPTPSGSASINTDLVSSAQVYWASGGAYRYNMGAAAGTPAAALCLNAAGDIIKVVGANCY